VGKTVAGIFVSPGLGFLLALVVVLAVSWLFVKRTPLGVDRAFRVLQFFSASAYSLGHGGNDAQKTMGIIAVLLFAHGKLGGEFHVPFWVVMAAHASLALGTMAGGWRIVKTMGMGLTHLKPVGGFCAEVAGALTLFTATHLNVPVSTTHTITGAIVGVGSVTKARGIRWSVASRIVYAWIFTIPAAGLVAAGAVSIAHALHAW
jgi:PiT family inorganic phosphate transporter